MVAVRRGRTFQVERPDPPGCGVPRLGGHAMLQTRGNCGVEPFVLLVLGLCLLGLLAVR